MRELVRETMKLADSRPLEVAVPLLIAFGALPGALVAFVINLIYTSITGSYFNQLLDILIMIIPGGLASLVTIVHRYGLTISGLWQLIRSRISF